jgi:hypothetical protein
MRCSSHLWLLFVVLVFNWAYHGCSGLVLHAAFGKVHLVIPHCFGLGMVWDLHLAFSPLGRLGVLAEYKICCSFFSSSVSAKARGMAL